MCIRDRSPLSPKSDFGKSRALLPEKAPLWTLSPGGGPGKERSFRCARFPVKSWIWEGISRPRSTRAIIWPPTVRNIPPQSKIRLWKISRVVARESSSLDSKSRRGAWEGEEFSLREISREKLDLGRYFSAALDKGDHRAAQSQKFSLRVECWTLKNFGRSVPKNGWRLGK